MPIDTATAADIPALSELLTLLFTQEAEFASDSAAQARGLARIIDNPGTGVILVARRDDQIVGMVSLLYTISTAIGAKVALLEDVVVAPHARGAGVGSQLLTQAIAVARAGGCKRISLLTDRSNERAQRLYRKHGFAASTMMPMRLLLN